MSITTFRTYKTIDLINVIAMDFQL